jgi:hypothetical protein
MKGKYITTTTKTVDELIENDEDPPFMKLEDFPNKHGINLCNVESFTWARQDDGQYLSFSVQLIPASEEEKEEEDGAVQPNLKKEKKKK